MNIWRLMASTALTAPEGTGDGAGGKEGESKAEDKGSAANPVEYGFADNLGDMTDETTGFVVETDNSAAQAAMPPATDDEEADEPAADAELNDDGTPKKAEPKKADAEADDDPDHKLPKGVRRRLERANRQRDAAIAEAAALKAKATTPAEGEDKTTKAAPTEAPNAADFDDYETYLDAKALFEKSKTNPPKKVEKAADPEPKKAEDTAPKPDAEVLEAVAAIGEDIKTTHADLWTQVTAADNPLGLRITKDMLMAISDSDNPGEILQALADKPELSKEIAALTERQQVARIAKLDKPGDGKKKAEEPNKGAPPKKLSAAPDPIEATPKGAPVEVANPIKDFNEFERQRNEEDARKGAGGDFWS